jgi:cytochrome c oxidase subunit II
LRGSSFCEESFVSTKFWPILFGAVLAACFLLTAVAPLFDWWLPRNLCSFGPGIDALFYLIMGIVAASYLLTCSILVYAMYKYDHVPGRKASYTHGNHKLELVWTALPALILLFIAFAQVQAWSNVKYLYDWGSNNKVQTDTARVPDQVFELTARQFEWRMRYPSAGTNETMTKQWREGLREPRYAAEWQTTPNADDTHIVNELHTWKGAKVRMYLKSKDVLHSFFLPNLRIKQDAVPGKVIQVWYDTAADGVEANCKYNDQTKEWDLKDGEKWELVCAELCGWGHYKMRAHLYIHESKADYEKWLTHAQQEEHRTQREEVK